MVCDVRSVVAPGRMVAAGAVQDVLSLACWLGRHMFQGSPDLVQVGQECQVSRFEPHSSVCG